jgi:hypothetical protein
VYVVKEKRVGTQRRNAGLLLAVGRRGFHKRGSHAVHVCVVYISSVLGTVIGEQRRSESSNSFAIQCHLSHPIRT